MYIENTPFQLYYSPKSINKHRVHIHLLTLIPYNGVSYYDIVIKLGNLRKCLQIIKKYEKYTHG